jgi:hypothetical protein
MPSACVFLESLEKSADELKVSALPLPRPFCRAAPLVLCLQRALFPPSGIRACAEWAFDEILKKSEGELKVSALPPRASLHGPLLWYLCLHGASPPFGCRACEQVCRSLGPREERR